jgi:hypothetical protein
MTIPVPPTPASQPTSAASPASVASAAGPASPTPVPAPYRLVVDVMAILTALQDQIDDLNQALAVQEYSIDLLLYPRVTSNGAVRRTTRAGDDGTEAGERR